jgi:hypothetical protein
MRALLVVAIAGAVLGRPGVAGAAELSARGPVDCLDESELRFRVERSIGMPLAQAASLRFAVETRQVEAGYEAQIVVTEDGSQRAEKQRVLSAAGCDELADAVSVAIALALGAADGDPSRVSDTGIAARARPAPEGAPAGSGPAVASSAGDSGSAAAAAAAGVSTETASGAWEPSLSAWVLGDTGSLPGPGLGAALELSLAWRRLLLRAIGTVLFEQHADVELVPSPAPGADLALYAGSLLGCTTPFGRGRLASLACVGMEVGRLAGVGTGVPSPRQGSALWLAPRLDLGALWSLPASPLRLGITLSAVAPMNRDNFALTDIGTVHRPPSMVGRLSFGVGLRFD